MRHLARGGDVAERSALVARTYFPSGTAIAPLAWPFDPWIEETNATWKREN